MNYKRTPDAILIGYKKVATTSLRNMFSLHPEINWSRKAHYFISAEFDEMDSEKYLSQFENEVTPCFIDMFEGLSIGMIHSQKNVQDRLDFVPGESFENYHIEPNPSEVAFRIKKVIPDAKIIIMIRNQEDWLRSYYLHHINDCPEYKRGFTDFLNTIEGKSALNAGLYNYHIESYFKLFGKENVHVILIEKLKTEQEKTMRCLCEFLNISFHPVTGDSVQKNKGRGTMNGNLVRLLSGFGISDRFIAKVRPALEPLRGYAMRNSYFQKIINKDVINKSEKYMINSFYSASNFHTSKLLGVNLKKFGYPL